MSEQSLQTTTACEECGAPVSTEQRYCVQCGAHRRTVSDPAGRYFSESSAARSRVAAAVARGGTVRSARRWSPGLIAALLIALIPVAAAVGIAVGRSSNNMSPALIKALDKRDRLLPASDSASTATASQNTSTATAHLGGGVTAGSGKSSKSSSGKSPKSKSASKRSASSASSSGSGAPSVSTKVTPSQSKQGAADAEKVAKAKGKNYVKQESSLPSVVSP